MTDARVKYTVQMEDYFVFQIFKSCTLNVSENYLMPWHVQLDKSGTVGPQY